MVNHLFSSWGPNSYHDRGSTVLLVDRSSALGKRELECATVVVKREAFKFSWAFKIKDGGYSRKIQNAVRSLALTINSPAVRAREVVLINIFWPYAIQESPHVREFGFRNPASFSCRIQNPGPWNPDYSWRNPDPTNDWSLESMLHQQKFRNPVPVIRNPPRGIQNPRLSWIPLHCRGTILQEACTV